MGDDWRRLAEWASKRRSFVAGRWVERGHRLADLPAVLGCDPQLAWHVAVCLPPRGDDLDQWTRTVSSRFGLDPERVATLARLLA